MISDIFLPVEFYTLKFYSTLDDILTLSNHGNIHICTQVYTRLYKSLYFSLFPNLDIVYYCIQTCVAVFWNPTNYVHRRTNLFDDLSQRMDTTLFWNETCKNQYHVPFCVESLLTIHFHCVQKHKYHHIRINQFYQDKLNKI